MKKPAKTYPVIRWADGNISRVWKKGRMWTFHVPDTPDCSGGEHGTDSMWGVKDVAENYGGSVEREPNPHYAQQLESYEQYRARRLLRMFF